MIAMVAGVVWLSAASSRRLRMLALPAAFRRWFIVTRALQFVALAVILWAFGMPGRGRFRRPAHRFTR